MNKMNKAFVIISLFILLALALIAVSAQQGCQSQAECFQNEDCVKVQLTCCPCNSGGTEQCVPKALATVYEDRMKDCPPQNELLCTALYNCKISNCTCVKGKCGPE